MALKAASSSTVLRANLSSAKAVLPVRRCVRALAVRAQLAEKPVSQVSSRLA